MNKITQKNCDDLLSPIIKKLYPRCLLCNGLTQVAHHHIKKEKSLTLRYNLNNLIPLCNGCHFKLRFHESYWASKIVDIKGLDWFRKLDKLNKVKVKPNYKEIYQKLSNKLKELNK